MPLTILPIGCLASSRFTPRWSIQVLLGIYFHFLNTISYSNHSYMTSIHFLNSTVTLKESHLSCKVTHDLRNQVKILYKLAIISKMYDVFFPYGCAYSYKGRSSYLCLFFMSAQGVFGVKINIWILNTSTLTSFALYGRIFIVENQLSKFYNILLWEKTLFDANIIYNCNEELNC